MHLKTNHVLRPLAACATVGLMLLIPALLVGQPAMPSAPTQAPIDGGLGLLAAAGSAYAYRKLRSNREAK